MSRNPRLLPVAVAVAAGLLFVPGSWAWLVLLVSMFVAGCLIPDRPVAVSTAMTALGLFPCALLLAITGASWITSGWHGIYPLRLDSWPGALFVAGDLTVRVIVTWGWAVFAAYMGAGIALRRRLRAAN